MKFDDTSCGRSAHTCVTDDLFKSGYDDIVYEGELMKFKPGLSQNFVSRYVQISQRAFRYFRNQYDAVSGRPIVSFRKQIVYTAKPYLINKGSYLKRGTRITQSGKEDDLFDNAFELELIEDYEDNYLFRDIERAVKEEEERREFRKMLKLKKR